MGGFCKYTSFTERTIASEQEILSEPQGSIRFIDNRLYQQAEVVEAVEDLSELLQITLTPVTGRKEQMYFHSAREIKRTNHPVMKNQSTQTEAQLIWVKVKHPTKKIQCEAVKHGSPHFHLDSCRYEHGSPQFRPKSVRHHILEENRTHSQDSRKNQGVIREGNIRSKYCQFNY